MHKIFLVIAPVPSRQLDGLSGWTLGIFLAGQLRFLQSTLHFWVNHASHQQKLTNLQKRAMRNTSEIYNRLTMLTNLGVESLKFRSSFFSTKYTSLEANFPRKTLVNCHPDVDFIFIVILRRWEKSTCTKISRLSNIQSINWYHW